MFKILASIIIGLLFIGVGTLLVYLLFYYSIAFFIVTIIVFILLIAYAIGKDVLHESKVEEE